MAISCFVIFSVPKDTSQSSRFAHPGSFGGLEGTCSFFCAFDTTQISLELGENARKMELERILIYPVQCTGGGEFRKDFGNAKHPPNIWAENLL